jgi:hypothetical protein
MFFEKLHRVDFVAAFVRHPLAYYESVWRFVKWFRDFKKNRHRVWRPWDTVGVVEELWDDDFNDWALRFTEEQPCWQTRLFETFVGPDKGEHCHFIGRTESMETDVRNLLLMLGHGDFSEVSLRHCRRNMMPRWQVPRVKWTDEAKDAVLRSERLVVSRFYGSRFGERFFAALNVTSDYHIKDCRPRIKGLFAELHPERLEKNYGRRPRGARPSRR